MRVIKGVWTGQAEVGISERPYTFYYGVGTQAPPDVAQIAMGKDPVRVHAMVPLAPLGPLNLLSRQGDTVHGIGT